MTGNSADCRYHLSVEDFLMIMPYVPKELSKNTARLYPVEKAGRLCRHLADRFEDRATLVEFLVRHFS